MGSLSMVAESVGGRLIGADASFDSVSTDTRNLEAGQLFIALRGERFDAAGFVNEAALRGAAGVVVEQRQDTNLGQVEVGDSRRALGDLARSWRKRFNPAVIAVTGSNGKTTVKEMIAAILASELGDDAESLLVTAGNLNNDIGLPLTVLKLREHHSMAVLEMGASHQGEIDYLSGIAQPGVGVITNAAPAHLEGFGSLKNVAVSKGELFAMLGGTANSSRTCAVINRDDDFFDYWKRINTADEIRTFGLSENADYHATGIVETDAGESAIEAVIHTPDGDFELHLPMSGRHNVLNALAATAAARAAGASLDATREGLSRMVNVAGRLKPVANSLGITFYDDSYNANPASVSAAIEFLAAIPGETWLVLGNMAELGEDARALHQAVGEQARLAGISRLLGIGDLSQFAIAGFGEGGVYYDSMDTLATAILAECRPGMTLLIKGSRSMGLDKLVDRLATAERATG